MLSNKKWSLLLVLLTVASLVLAACQPVVETVVVTQVVEGEVVEVEVTAPPKYPEGPILAEELVPCLPLPEIATSGGGVGLASQVSEASKVVRAMVIVGGRARTSMPLCRCARILPTLAFKVE